MNRGTRGTAGPVPRPPSLGRSESQMSPPIYKGFGDRVHAAGPPPRGTGPAVPRSPDPRKEPPMTPATAPVQWRYTELGRRLARLSVEVQLAPEHAVVALEQRVDQLDRLVQALTGDDTPRTAT